MTDYNSPDEILAVVDEENVEIGSATRREIHERKLLHRAVHVLVFGPDGRLLIQQRSSCKDTFPLHWECVGGHLGPGEEYRAAAEREVVEELGVTARDFVHLASIPASEASGWEFIEVFRAVIDQKVAPDASEVIDTHWLETQNLQQEMRSPARLYSPIFLNMLRCVAGKL
jgi:isopentenyl-diphosphate delta-isomerase type 1